MSARKNGRNKDNRKKLTALWKEKKAAERKARVDSKVEKKEEI